MNPIIVWSILFATILVLGAAVGVLSFYCIRFRSQYMKLRDTWMAEFPEQLALATSEQLLSELRSRPGIPYLMLTPVISDTTQGLTIEVHGIPPIPCFSMLHAATQMTLQQLKANGVDLSDVPGFDPNQE